jgi:hypothetical protein
MGLTVNNLKNRVNKVMAGIDVTRLSGEQLRMLDVTRLTFDQRQRLDVTQLTDEQIYQIGFENMTDGQLNALVCADEDERLWVESLSDDELDAVAEGRLWRWKPGYITSLRNSEAALDEAIERELERVNLPDDEIAELIKEVSRGK